MAQISIDLHNHSCLSPCADDDLTPFLLAIQAKERGIDILGLTDHNCGRNLPAFNEACALTALIPFFGIEVTSIEEVHLLVLFDELTPALEYSWWVEEHLLPIPNTPKHFGHQLVCDEEGLITEVLDRMYAAATTLSFEEIAERGFSAGALVIPAHIDRPSHSALAHLGFLPDLPYSAVEVVHINEPLQRLGYRLIQSSDAHRFEEVGIRNTTIELHERSSASLIAALSG